MTRSSGAAAETRRRRGPKNGSSRFATSSASGTPVRNDRKLWDLYNTRHRPGEHFRVFPLSNWTELDIWQYVDEQKLELPHIYFAHRRTVFRRTGMLLAIGPWTQPRDGVASEQPFETTVRYRTVGDMTCTAAVESTASTPAEIIVETAVTRVSERGATRADDRFSDAAMEDRKREGYF